MHFNRVLWIAFSISLIALGAVCIVNPLDTMAFLTYFVGFIMFLSGLGEIIYFMQMRYAMILVDDPLVRVWLGVAFWRRRHRAKLYTAFYRSVAYSQRDFVVYPRLQALSYGRKKRESWHYNDRLILCATRSLICAFPRNFGNAH